MRDGWLAFETSSIITEQSCERQVAVKCLLTESEKADGDTTKYTLKRAKRGEVSYVPQHPQQQDDASLEEQRILLVEASKKARLDHSFVREKMDLTFSLRRKEIVEEQPMVMEVQKRWPALFFKEQVSV